MSENDSIKPAYGDYASWARQADVSYLQPERAGTPSEDASSTGGYVAVPTPAIASDSSSDTKIFSRKNEGLGDE